ncbi:serine hydrolase [Streptomyces sp. NPDC051577]|uniref:serine hydrolase n=1 Tax=Streptomyces sp. NPDC051577 TaxID=3155166 RepID=UPI0034499C0B
MAVSNLRTGQTFAQSEGSFETASIVKIDIAATLFLRAADTGRQVTAAELAQITHMIEKSSNTAATSLWEDIGGTDGLNRANRQIGLRRSTAGPSRYWGLTQTDANDQLVLLRQVFGSESKLQPAARAVIRTRMATVDSGQRWGISAAGSEAALKNGWIQRTNTKRWNINSMGRITYEGDKYLIAVLTKNNLTKGDGIRTVEAVAQNAIKAISASSTAASCGNSMRPTASSWVVNSHD